MLITVGIGLVIGFAVYWFSRSDDDFLGRREALLLVALSWLWGAAVAALPFWLWAMFATITPDHPFHSWIPCYFESMSGLTTTGATVLNTAPNDIESLPHGLLLWRSLTHWLGGLGIVVLFVAVLPTLGVGAKKLFQVEATGPTQSGVRPRIKETARVLWLIYLGMTVLEIVLLRIFGMTWFDSVCHTFATLATGGFSTQNASAGAYHGFGINLVLIMFMFFAGVNFGLYYKMFRGHVRQALADTEFRMYVGFIVFSSVIITIFLANSSIETSDGRTLTGVAAALHHSVFQVVSIQTTTGYATADFDKWHFVPKTILLALMFIGGSAGSTGGGIKVIRILITFKVMIAEIERIFRPNVVRTVKVGRMTIDPELRLATVVYVFGIFVLCAIGAFLIYTIESFYGSTDISIDFTTASTASIATLNNIGPGLAKVGAIQNYGWFSHPSMAVMCVLMALGRLEVYAIMVLFVPRFWRGE